MEIVLVVLSSLSIFGFLIIFTSLYLLLCVPTKLNTISRFAIHGHDFAIGFAQIYMTIGVTPTFVLPCTIGYASGLFSTLGIMSALDQFLTTIVLISVGGWFAIFISLIQMLALVVKMPERIKKNEEHYRCAQSPEDDWFA